MHRIREGEELRNGLNVEVIRNQGFALILYASGLGGVRVRIFYRRRWPNITAWQA